MNKSLVLVMCDVLVLSAMSLSTGGFDMVETQDVIDVESAISNALKTVTAKNSALEDSLRERSNELASVKRDRDILNKRYFQATNEIRSLDSRLGAAAGSLRNASNELASVKRDRDILNKRYFQATNEIRSLDSRLGAAAGSLRSASNELASVKRDRDILNKQYIQATDMVNVLSNRIDEISGSGLERRQKLIQSCEYSVYINYGKGKHDIRYSPLVHIGDETYVIVYLSRGHVKDIKEVLVKPMSSLWHGRNDKTIGTFESVWGLLDEDEDILFFQIKCNPQLESLSVGAETESSRDHFYWFSTTDNGAKHAVIMSANSIGAVQQYFKIGDGALLISENQTSVIKMAVPQAKLLRAEVDFTGMTKERLQKIK